MVLGYAEQQADCWTFTPSATTARALCPTFTGSMPTRQAPPEMMQVAHGEPIGHRWALRRRFSWPVSKPYWSASFLPPYALSHHLGVFWSYRSGQKQPDDGAAAFCIGPQPKKVRQEPLKALPPAYWPLTPTMNFASGTQPQVAKTASMALSKATRPRSRQLLVPPPSTI